ncbi:MAG: HAMP domain-containing histidine kinase [Bacteroidales bacterium]|nr:HAMP domain-containing histidine kinase [Bacteroidales bacterium]
MRHSVRKIGLLILMVIVLPVVIFSVYEIGNLRQNEKIIQDIYRNQLDAILFSINQYSDDIISNLAGRIENSLNEYKSGNEPELSRLITEVPSVKGLILFDKNLGYLSSIPASYEDSAILAEIITGLGGHEKTLGRLQTYLRGGYRKMEIIGNTRAGIQWIVFLTQVEEQEVINVLILDPEEFVGQALDPKIQEIAKGKFYITAYHAGEDLPFYVSNKQYKSGKVSEKRPFWLLNDYLMGIELKDLTITDLARDRSKRNLLLVGLMDIILLFGAWLIFRNIARQVELTQLKNDFISSVSHEIRTPLALITMYIETLEMERVTDANKIREYYAVLLNETTRLSGMVNRILSFSQIEGKKRKYFFSDTRLNEIVENTLLTFRYTLENKGFVYSFEPDSNLPVISADREAVTDALVNLVDNAIKYSDGNKSIVVRTGSYDNYVYVEVEDQGIGISKTDQKHIFDKFYRVTEKNLANKVKGSGLGLAIVKHIMDAHKGTIYVKSTPGFGSLFRLLFPMK